MLDRNGQVVLTIANPTLLNGPWQLTVNDKGTVAQVFVSNVLSGTVTRINLQIQNGTVSVINMTQIASGFTHRLDPAAFVVGPAGLVYDPATDILQVASTADNTINGIIRASITTDTQMATTIVVQDPAHLHGPLGLILLPNGNLLAANSDAQNADPNQPSELVEYTPAGQFVSQISVDPNLGGAFGLAVTTINGQPTLAAVDDNTSTISLWGGQHLQGTTTTLNASTNPAMFGQTVTFTAAVAATGPLGGTPGGTVTFTIDGRPQNPVLLTNGTAVLTLTTLGARSAHGHGNLLRRRCLRRES